MGFDSRRLDHAIKKGETMIWKVVSSTLPLELGNFRSRYGFLSKMRNHLDIIHYKSMPENFDQVIGNQHDADLPELSLKHLYEMLEIFYKIFTKNDFPYSPIANKR